MQGTKTRSRDATLSRYAGIDIGQLNLSAKIAESHSGEVGARLNCFANVCLPRD